MMLKKTALTLALSLGLVAGAHAVVRDFGVVTAPNLYTGSFIIEGQGVSFTDDLTFTVNNALTSGGAVNNVAQFNLYDITNMSVNLYSGSVGSGTLLLDLSTNPASTPNFFAGAGLFTPGNYYFEVSGLTTGTLGGNYTFTANTALPVPEPETYAMLLAGLGLMGTIARRRKSKSV